MIFTPSPVTNCHTFSDPLPLERDILYGRPLGRLLTIQLLIFKLLSWLLNPFGPTAAYKGALKLAEISEKLRR